MSTAIPAAFRSVPSIHTTAKKGSQTRAVPGQKMFAGRPVTGLTLSLNL